MVALNTLISPHKINVWVISLKCLVAYRWTFSNLVISVTYTACKCGPILYYNIPDVVEQDVYTIRLKSGLYNKTNADLTQKSKISLH